MKNIIIYALLIFCGNTMFAIDWGNTKPIVDSMLLHYQNNKNFQSVVTDEWIRTDGSAETIGDTIFAFKYNSFGYTKNAHNVQVFTDHYDIYINNLDSTIIVHEMTPENIQKIEQMMPTMEVVIRAFSLCDSARLVSSVNGVNTIDFYVTHSLINKSRIKIDANGWIRDIWRFYTNNAEYMSQHTKFVVIDALSTNDIPELKQDRYIIKTGNILIPSQNYHNYELTLLNP